MLLLAETKCFRCRNLIFLDLEYTVDSICWLKALVDGKTATPSGKYDSSSSISESNDFLKRKTTTTQYSCCSSSIFIVYILLFTF